MKRQTADIVKWGKADCIILAPLASWLVDLFVEQIRKTNKTDGQVEIDTESDGQSRPAQKPIYSPWHFMNEHWQNFELCQFDCISASFFLRVSGCGDVDYDN